MNKSPDHFIKNLGKDFTRNYKLTFKYVINLLLSMGGNNIYKERLEYFDYDSQRVSSSAFFQKRGNILLFALPIIFKNFMNSYENHKTFRWYRLLAIDNSKLNIAQNPKDYDTYTSFYNKSVECFCTEA